MTRAAWTEQAKTAIDVVRTDQGSTLESRLGSLEEIECYVHREVRLLRVAIRRSHRAALREEKV